MSLNIACYTYQTAQQLPFLNEWLGHSTPELLSKHMAWGIHHVCFWLNDDRSQSIRKQNVDNIACFSLVATRVNKQMSCLQYHYLVLASITLHAASLYTCHHPSLPSHTWLGKSLCQHGGCSAESQNNTHGLHHDLENCEITLIHWLYR